MPADLKYALIIIGFCVLIPLAAGLGWLLGFGHEENGPCSGDGDTGRG